MYYMFIASIAHLQYCELNYLYQSYSTNYFMMSYIINEYQVIDSIFRCCYLCFELIKLSYLKQHMAIDSCIGCCCYRRIYY